MTETKNEDTEKTPEETETSDEALEEVAGGAREVAKHDTLQKDGKAIRQVKGAGASQQFFDGGGGGGRF